MTKPLVSILIPVYNREKLVRRAIESAINQTYENIEVIAVDNKSTDRTYEVLKEYAGKYPGVTVYQNEENIGPVRNWKKCVEYATGCTITSKIFEFNLQQLLEHLNTEKQNS